MNKISSWRMSKVSSSFGEEPVIYLRYYLHGSLYWTVLNTEFDIHDSKMLCDCGAKVHLSPCFERPDSFPAISTVAAVRSRIYVFGGYDINTKKEMAEVSYIDTNCPEQGWIVCQNSMLINQSSAYAVTYDDDKVVVVGGISDGCEEPTRTQVYYPKTDIWESRDNNIEISIPYKLSGHAIVDKEGGKRLILFHSDISCELFSYDVEKNHWDYHWGADFGKFKFTSAFVDGIYYVIDSSAENDFYLSGYDFSSAKPKPLPVEILPKKFGEMEAEGWTPMEDSSGFTWDSILLSLGNSKLAMIWYYDCSPNGVYKMFSIRCAIFKMIQEEGANGGLKLVAEPLSKVCYHLDGDFFDSLLLV